MSVRKFFSCQSGGVLLLFSLLFPVLLLAGGCTLDYLRALDARSALQSSADAAALAAAKDPNIPSDKMALFANNYVNQNLAHANLVTNHETSVRKDGNTVEVQVSSKVDTSFMRIFGWNSLDIQAVSRALPASSFYERITFVVDGSLSMAIGATREDQDAMVRISNCAIACHYKDSGFSASYQQARSQKIQMRIDVVREGLRNVVTRMRDAIKQEGPVEFSIIFFGNELNEYLPPTTSFAQVLQAIDQLELPKSQDYLGTNMHKTVAQIADSIHSGSGNAPDDRKSIIVLVTDGIENDTTGTVKKNDTIKNWRATGDFVYNSPNAFDIQSPASDLCDPLKRGSHDIYVELLEYLVPTGGYISAKSAGKFAFIGTTLNDLSEKRLRACSGDSRFRRASTPADIVDSLIKIGDAITANHPAYLTN